jgi:2-keto-3-deoxy-L-rhamnonate aldolase RhmA
MTGAVPSRFRTRLQARETMVGSFVNLGCSLTAEIMGIAGFDWLVVDLEHGAGDEPALLAQLQALGQTGTAAIVRVEGVDLARIQHALDLGADGVMVPRIRTVADAQACVDGCRYSAARGVARYNRSWHWGLASRSLAAADAEVVCVIQIETPDALESVDAIAALDGVDVLFVGPSDLGHSLGLDAPPDDPRLLERVAAVTQAASKHGKIAGMLVGTIDQARAYRDLGFTFLGCASDSGLLALAAQRVVGDLRELSSARQASEGARAHADAEAVSR